MSANQFHSNPPDSQRVVTVIQGEFQVSNDPLVVLSTILGSCVSVCIFDETAHVGGMNHFLLPGDSDASVENVKYGTFAMETLINRLIKDGADRFRLKAKLFGGGRMTQNMSDIGRSNVEFGQRFLVDEGIPCISESIGGTQARRVQFVPTTGAARQRFVPKGEVKDDIPRPKLVPAANDITLF